MENNFKCPKTDKEFFIPRHITIMSSSGAVYKDGYGKILVNPENGENLIPIEKNIDYSEINLMVGTGNDKDGRAKRTEMLKKRSKQHFKREISEDKYEKNKKLVKDFKNQ